MNYLGQFEYSAINGWYTAQVNRRNKTGNKCVHTAKLNTFHFFFSSDILQSVDFGGSQFYRWRYATSPHLTRKIF